MEIKNYTRKDIEKDLQKSFALSLEDKDFVALCNKLKLPESEIIKYTSKLEDTVAILKKCKGCKGLNECSSDLNGYVLYPTVENNRLEFTYIPCKYKKKENHNVSYFDAPSAIKDASMKEIKATGAERIEVIKYMKKLIDEYSKDSKIKGIYLHGSFGSGKSYLMSALVNELSKKYNLNAIIMYYPALLKTLKSSFNDEYNSKLESLTKTDILMIDDIGAERNSDWSRDEILGPILQYRMDNNLLTIFTSNYKIDELETHLSQTKEGTDIVKARRIIERIKYLSKEIELTGKNMRN